MIRLKYELTLTRHILSRIITLKYVAAYRLLISRAGLNKQKESGNETQVENASELRQRQSLWGGLHPRAPGKSTRRQFKITASSRHGDVSQAGSRSGCLPTGQREPDPDHTPPRSAGQPLKWTVTHDRRTRRGNAF